MGITLKGAFIIFAVVIPSLGHFFVITVAPVIMLIISKLLLGAPPTFLLRVFNYSIDFIQHMFLAYMALLLECVLQLRIAYTLVFKGDMKTEKNAKSSFCVADIFSAPQPRRFKVVILNHRSRIDWLLLYPFFARTNITSSVRFVLKHELGQIPVFGWSMQLFRYIFLTRKWINDEAHIHQMIEYYKRTEDGCTIVLFPEGTDLSPGNLTRSQAYATQNGLPIFNYVLNPRFTGFVEIIKSIGTENIDEIVDLTMGYTDYKPGERPSEPSVVNGRMPKKIHILCTRHRFVLNAQDSNAKEKLNTTNDNDEDCKNKNDSGALMMEDVTSNDAQGLRDWLSDRFVKKELLLSKFYTSNPVGFDSHHVKDVFEEDCNVLTYDEDEIATANPSSTKVSRFIKDVELWRGFISVILFWVAPFVFWPLCMSFGLIMWCVLCFACCMWGVRKEDGFAKWLLLKETNTQHNVKQD